MSACDAYFDLISAFVDGELSEEEQLRLNAHLSVCPNCAAVYDAMSAVSASLQNSAEEPPADLHETIMKRIALQRKVKRSQKLVKLLPPVLAAAACAAVCITLGTGMAKVARTDSAKTAAETAAGAAPAAAFAVEAPAAFAAEVPAEEEAETFATTVSEACAVSDASEADMEAPLAAPAAAFGAAPEAAAAAAPIPMPDETSDVMYSLYAADEAGGKRKAEEAATAPSRSGFEPGAEILSAACIEKNRGTAEIDDLPALNRCLAPSGFSAYAEGNVIAELSVDTPDGPYRLTLWDHGGVLIVEDTLSGNCYTAAGSPEEFLKIR